MSFRNVAAFLVVVLLGLSPFLLLPPPGAVLAQAEPPRIIVVGVGDVFLGRLLGVRMEKENDYSLPFRAVAAELTAADIAFGNFEGAFCPKAPYPDKGIVFRIRPRAVEGLAAAGFGVMSTANNHAADCGDAGLEFTPPHLQEAGILSAGTGTTFAAAHAPAILERQGVRFAFLAYAYTPRRDRAEAPESGTRGPVVAGRDPEQVARDVAAARALADVVIVSVHDGTEYTERVAPETEQFARAAIDAGATVVFGHHPHVVQRVESYGNGWIFYSLGNFVFDQTRAGTRTGLLARLTFSGARLEKVEAIPIVIDPLSEPRLAKPQEAEPVLAVIGWPSTVLWPAAPAPVTAAAAPKE